MAISKKYKEKLIDFLEQNLSHNITKKNIIEFLGVAPNWISRNIKELNEMGFNLIKEKPSNSVFNNILSNLSDLSYFDNFLLKYFINKFYINFGLVAPFQIEGKEFRNIETSSSFLDTLDLKIEEENFDYISLLSNIPDITIYPLNITVYLTNLINSLDLLKDINIEPTLVLIISNTFKDIHNLTPTQEQLQVVAKAIKYASDDTCSYTSVSIQADAGSSKSTCALVIQHILRAKLNPLIVAKTNKSISGMEYSKTISKFLQENVGLSTIKDSWEERRLKAFQKSKTIDFLIVDESSQVGELDRIILSTVCKKILYIGDQNQCKPIHDRQAITEIYLHSLKTQYRFFNSKTISGDKPFQVLFTELYKEKRRDKLEKMFEKIVIGTFHTLGYYVNQDNKYIVKNDFNNSFSDHLNLLKQYVNDDSIIISYSQSSVDTLNNLLNEGPVFKIGTKVSLKINDYTHDQFNGYQYRIIEVLPDNKFLCKSIENGLEYCFHGSWLSIAYAITTMSSQGSQWKHVLGIDKTSPSFELWTDRYVITTRASNSISFLSSLGIINPENISFTLLSPVEVLENFNKYSREGNRNMMLYGSLKDLNKINAPSLFYEQLKIQALNSGLPKEEINTLFENNSSNYLKINSLQTNEVMRITQYFTPIFNNGKSLRGENRILSYDDANKYTNKLYVAEELRYSNRIVIDCDSVETVALFSKYLNQTESYVSENGDSAHLVFTTDKLVPTKHKKDIDLLGNSQFSLRNIKENKTPNNVSPIELTQEILDIFNDI